MKVVPVVISRPHSGTIRVEWRERLDTRTVRLGGVRHNLPVWGNVLASSGWMDRSEREEYESTRDFAARILGPAPAVAPGA